MELWLWRWSTSVQVTSLLMIAVFFWVLGRSIRTAAVRWWVRAWLANLAALAVTQFYWFAQPPDWALQFVIGPLYMVTKTTFVLFLVQGAWIMRRPGVLLFSPRVLAAGLAAYAVAAALVCDSINKVGVVQHTVMGGVLIGFGVTLLIAFDLGLVWLAIGLVTRGALSLAEAGAYALILLGPRAASPSLSGVVGKFQASTSTYDSSVEWLLALGCVLAVSEWVQRELLQSNAELLSAQEDLRTLADRDVLTGLAHRRSLPEIFRAAQPEGATLVFIDLDGFKQINDLHGHTAGDDALRRFSAALRECFRPRDAIVRYGGDEFLVVASGLDKVSVAGRIEMLRDRLRRAVADGPPIAFSVGVADLPAGGHPDAALNRADEAMYQAKRGRGAASDERAARPAS